MKLKTKLETLVTGDPVLWDRLSMRGAGRAWVQERPGKSRQAAAKEPAVLLVEHEILVSHNSARL